MMVEHIVRSYDHELDSLRLVISRMGGAAENQLTDSIDALMKLDAKAAREVQIRDKLLDEMEHEVEKATIIIFARRAPVADDLREIVACLKMSGVIERMGDYAKNIARRTVTIAESDPLKIPATIPAMADEATAMLRKVMDAFAQRSAEKAMEVWESDERLDHLHNASHRQILEQMMEMPEKVDSLTQLMMIAKNLERIGDQATNVAEQIFYAITGKPIGEIRPKSDTTSDALADVSSAAN